MATARKATTSKAAPKAAAKETTAETAAEFTKAAQDQFQQFAQAVQGNADEMRGKSEEFVAAVQESTTLTQEHFKTVGTDMVEAAQGEMSDAVQFASDLAKANSVSDALEIQRSYWTSLFENRMDRARSVTDASVEVAKEAMEPVAAPFASMFGNTSAFDKFFTFPGKA